MIQRITAVMTGNSEALQPTNGAGASGKKEDHKI
jgi:hypothetical protein